MKTVVVFTAFVPNAQAQLAGAGDFLLQHAIEASEAWILCEDSAQALPFLENCPAPAARSRNTA